MIVEKLTQGVWCVLTEEESEKEVKAEIWLDLWHQVEKLVFRTDDKEEQLAIKRLVLSHGLQFVKNRSVGCFVFVVTRSNPELTEEDSDRLMSFGRIHESVAAMEKEELDKGLERLVTVVHGEYDDFMQMIARASLEILVQHEFVVAPSEICRYPYDNSRVRIKFKAPEDHKFRFWKSVHGEAAAPEGDLRHPALDGKSFHPLINASTDAFIGRSAIRSLYCPEDAVTRDTIGGTWSYVNHSYCAEGSTFEMEVDVALGVTVECKDTLKGILLSALGIGDKYVGISGGFYPPPQSQAL